MQDYFLYYHQILFFFLIGALGAIFGSFAGAIIYRAPLGISIIWPRSSCNNCEKQLKFYHLIPIISWLLLKGKCEFCKKYIGTRELVIELIFMLLSIAIVFKYGLSFVALEKFIFCFFLICIAYIDLDYFFIPIWLISLFSVFGLFIVSYYFFNPQDWIALNSSWYFLPTILQNKNFCIIDHLIASFLGAVFFSLINIFFTYLLRKTKRLNNDQWAMGWGDPWLLAILGLFLGSKALLLTIFIASFLGSLCGIVQKLYPKNHGLGQDIASNALPYGPFLAVAAIFIYLV